MLEIPIFFICIDYCTKKDQNCSQSRLNVPEILVIWYLSTCASAVTVYTLAIIFMPTSTAFPFSYAYKAYLDNYASKITILFAFILELIFIASFASKLSWYFAYVQIYMVVISSCSKILR